MSETDEPLGDRSRAEDLLRSPTSALERDLRFRASLLDRLQQTLPDGILIVDSDRRVIAHNQRMLDMWKLPADAFSTGSEERGLEQLASQVADPGAFLRRLEWLYANPEKEDRDEIALADGRTFERIGMPVRGADGYARLWVYRNVTARKQSEERARLFAKERALRMAAEESEHRLRLLADVGRRLNGFPPRGDVEFADVARQLVPHFGDWCVLWLVDEARRLRGVAWATAAADLGAAVEVYAESSLDLSAPEGVAQVLASGKPVVLRALRGRRLTPFPDREIAPGRPSASPAHPAGAADPFTAAAAALRTSSYLAVPIRAAADECGGGVLVFGSSSSDDVFSQPVQALAEEVAVMIGHRVAAVRRHLAIAESLRVRDEFLGVASHELRTPVASLRLALDAVQRFLRSGSADLPRPFVTLLGNAHRQAEHVTKLTDTLLDVVRFQSGTLRLEPERVDLAALVSEVANDLSANREVPCRVDVMADERVVGFWDKGRVGQIVTNLLSNALKYGLGKPITVLIVVDGSFVEVAVEDQGIGIPTDRLGRIFEPFERAVSAKDFHGLGLGLFVVRQLVNLLGGSIAVRSRLGVGTTFSLRLPVTDPEPSVALH